jgi:hypothetical protein
MSNQPIAGTDNQPPPAVADGNNVGNDEGTTGGSNDSDLSVSTSSGRIGIEQSMLDVIKQLRQLNGSMLKLNDKMERLEYFMIGGLVCMKIKNKK